MSLITRPEIIVHLLPHSLIVGKVRIGRHTFLMDKSESEWDDNTLGDIFAEIKNTYHTDSIRVLLDDALCHTITVDIPSSVTNLRDYLREKIESEVGETPGPAEWDYKKAVFPLGKKDKAIVFVPHAEILKSLTKAANGAEVVIDAIEPVRIAQRRDEDPIVGLAMKEDLSGPDEDVLNISVSNHGSKKHQRAYIIALTVILLLILGAFAILGYLAYQNFFAGSQEEASSTAEITTPVQQEASPTPPPEPPVVLGKYKIQVLNGSGITGKAGDLKTKLTTAGFVDVTAQNATRFNYTGITIQSKVGLPKKVIDTITPLLGTTQATTGESLEASSTYDVVLILGK